MGIMEEDRRRHRTIVMGHHLITDLTMMDIIETIAIHRSSSSIVDHRIVTIIESDTDRGALIDTTAIRIDADDTSMKIEWQTSYLVVDAVFVCKYSVGVFCCSSY